ncbi:MAG: hypothetical protein ABR563_16515 [Pyrinomonadaceae bacterium]
MTEANRHRHDERAEKALRWLYGRRAEFEGAGVAERELAAAVGLSDEEATRAVDQLENREAVARIPHHEGDHMGFVLQPARGWGDVCEEFGAGAEGAGAA